MQEYKKENMNEDEVNHYMNMHKEGGVDNPKQAKRKWTKINKDNDAINKCNSIQSIHKQSYQKTIMQ